jgi:CRP-like cAMP-binding protein
MLGVTPILTDLTVATREVDPVERFIRRLAAYGPVEAGARTALHRAVQRQPNVRPHEAQRENVSPELCVLLSGWVCHFRLFGNGRRQITSLAVPGDLVDYSFLTGETSDICLRVTAPSQFGIISVAHFTAIAEQFPSLMRAALRAAATDAATSKERVLSLGVRTAVERVSHLLCELRHRLNVVGLVAPDNSYDLPMTQSDLGEALGLSMVHVNRTLQALRRDGTITLGRGRVTLHHPERLIALSGFDPAYLGPQLNLG